MAGNERSGKKLESTKAVPLKRWLFLKAEFMSSKHTEVKHFLEEKGIEVNEYAYRMANGWKRDKTRMLERAAKKAETYIALTAGKMYRDKIERRSNAWRVLQDTVLRHLGVRLADGTYVARTDLRPSDILMLAQAYDIATKGERLEDGQPTVVEKIEQVNTHTFRFDELPDHEFETIEREMMLSLPTEYDAHRENEVRPENAGGGGSEAVPPPALPGPPEHP